MNGKIREIPTTFVFFFNDIKSKLKMRSKEGKNMRKKV